MEVQHYLASREGEKPLGVYACYDEKGNLQYVGYSRNMVLAIKVSRNALLGASGPCSSVSGPIWALSRA